MTGPLLPDPPSGADAAVLVQQLREQAFRLGLAWLWQEATVVTAGFRPTLTIDGDTVAVPAVSAVGRVAADQRVFVVRIPPSGVYVVGFAKDYTLPEPLNSSAIGTASSGTNEVYDAVLGSLPTFRGIPGHWYEVSYNPLMNAGTAAHRILVRIRDGVGDVPTTASTLVAEGQKYFAATGITGRQRVMAQEPFQSTGGLHTLGAFSLDPDSGVATPVGNRNLYVKDLGLRT